MSITTGKPKAEKKPESNEPLAVVARRIGQNNPAVGARLQAISDSRVKGN